MITNWVSALATIDAPLWLMGLCVHLKAVKSTIYTVLQYTSYCTNGICSIAIMPVQVQVHFVAQCLNMGHFALHTGPEMCRRQIIFFFVFVSVYLFCYMLQCTMVHSGRKMSRGRTMSLILLSQILPAVSGTSHAKVTILINDNWEYYKTLIRIMFERRIILKHHLTDSRLSFIITLLREIWYHPPSLPALVGNNRVHIHSIITYQSW